MIPKPQMSANHHVPLQLIDVERAPTSSPDNPPRTWEPGTSSDELAAGPGFWEQQSSLANHTALSYHLFRAFLLGLSGQKVNISRACGAPAPRPDSHCIPERPGQTVGGGSL